MGKEAKTQLCLDSGFGGFRDTQDCLDILEKISCHIIRRAGKTLHTDCIIHDHYSLSNKHRL